MSAVDPCIGPICPTCGYGHADCDWCCDLEVEDFEAICDCGLSDVGQHLLSCDVTHGNLLARQAAASPVRVPDEQEQPRGGGGNP